MRNTQRILALAGMTLAAGAVLGMNATVASAATTKGGQVTVAQPGPGDRGGDGRNDNRDHRKKRDRHWTVGHYANKKLCNWVGMAGEWRGRWDDYDCYKTKSRKGYVLVAHDYRGRGDRR
ncbi:hypothetical protein [Dactylosporangium fulvum]|uniref:Uncharacterized protein n=1 Tax=Dactylosporangium fulvum TaxID=53359 RepID=A0ABY5VRJ7_9ACTN|nr:hypothetical protein [Dactylosporangium fulvum]UWP78446.1 hypothetical protein Dfulv_24990 [Dactylosporangium fulvum]